MGATADVMNLGHALGSAHDELKPQTRADIERRENQLRSLVGSKTVDAHLAGGRALQAAYAARNQNLYDNDAILRYVMIRKSRENALGLPGAWQATYQCLGARPLSHPALAPSARQRRFPSPVAASARRAAAVAPAAVFLSAALNDNTTHWATRESPASSQPKIWLACRDTGPKDGVHSATSWDVRLSTPVTWRPRNEYD